MRSSQPEGNHMDDIKTVVKELRRIADAGERIAKTLEKQNRAVNFSPTITVTTELNDEEET